MKKYLLLSFAFLFTFKASAQMLDVSNYVTSMQMSEEFLKNLAACSPYEESKSSGLANVETAVTYKIIGLQDNGNCEVRIDSNAGEMNISAYQICSFSKETLKQFIPAMLNVLKNKNYTLENLSEMMQNEDNQTVMSIMMDEEICSIHRDAFDMTKNVREKLRDCEKFSETQKLGPTELTREIIGRNGDKCLFNIHILQKKPDLSSISGELVEQLKDMLEEMSDRYYDIKCEFSPSDITTYINILEAQVVPAIDSLDDMQKGLENMNPQMEMNFLQEHCEAVFPDLP